MITEKNNVFYCDCGFSWRRGMSGSHNCEDGLRAKLTDMAVQLANAESKCRELAAENAAQKSVIAENWSLRDALRQLIAGRPGGSYFIKWEPLIFKALNETPATDAFLAEVRASGVEMYADNLDSSADDAERDGFDDAVKFLRSEASGVRLFAAQLRKGAEL